MELHERIYKFNYEYSNCDKGLLAQVIDFNKDDFGEAISDVNEYRFKYDMDTVILGLKKLFGKRWKLIDSDTGVQEYIVGNISNGEPEVADATRVAMYIPIKGRRVLGFVEFRNYVKVDKFQQKIKMIESLLKRAKVRYNKTYSKVNGINTIRFESYYVSGNENFWGTLRLISK